MPRSLAGQQLLGARAQFSAVQHKAEGQSLGNGLLDQAHAFRQERPLLPASLARPASARTSLTLSYWRR